MRVVFFCLLIIAAIVIAGCKINLTAVDNESVDTDAVQPSVRDDARKLEASDASDKVPVEIPVIEVASVAAEQIDERYSFNASWACVDGYLGGFSGLGKSCKSEKTWMRYAEADCGSRCSGGCGVRVLQPVDACDGKESDSYLLQQGKQVSIAFDKFFILVELRKVYLNGKVEIDVDFGDELVGNTTLEPRKTLKYRNISITSNEQFYNREHPELSAAEFLVGKLMQQTTPIGSSACSLLKNAICPKDCEPAEDYDCCEVAGRCWVDGGCEFCAATSVLKGDWNGNGDVDDPDLDFFLKILDSRKGAGQNAKGYTYDGIFDFDNDEDVDNEDYIAFDAAYRKK